MLRLQQKQALSMFIRSIREIIANRPAPTVVPQDNIRDAARQLDQNGVGSFEKAWAAFQDGKKYGWYGCKMTFVGPSFKFIFPSVKQMISEGCKEIHCNYAFEPVYTEQEARTLYMSCSGWLITLFRMHLTFGLVSSIRTLDSPPTTTRTGAAAPAKC